MDADNGQDNRVTDFALRTMVSALVLILDRTTPAGHAHRHASLISFCPINHGIRSKEKIQEAKFLQFGDYGASVC